MLWVNKKADWGLLFLCGNQSRRKRIEFKPVKHYLKIGLVSHPAYAEGLVNTYITQAYSYFTPSKFFTPVFIGGLSWEAE